MPIKKIALFTGPDGQLTSKIPPYYEILSAGIFRQVQWIPDSHRRILCDELDQTGPDLSFTVGVNLTENKIVAQCDMKAAKGFASLHVPMPLIAGFGKTDVEAIEDFRSKVVSVLQKLVDVVDKATVCGVVFVHTAQDACDIGSRQKVRCFADNSTPPRWECSAYVGFAGINYTYTFTGADLEVHGADAVVTATAPGAGDA